MNRSNTEQKSGSRSVAASAAKTRLSGSWLIMARTVWLALVIPSLGLFVVGIPVYYAQLQTACVGPVACNVVGALTATGLHALLRLGFSASGYAAVTVTFWTIILAIWSAIGFLIFWRRSDEWFALLIALFLVLFNSTIPGPASVLALVYPALSAPTTLMSVLAQILLGLFLLLFPTGRFVPGWIGLATPLFIIQAVAFVLPTAIPWPVWLNGMVSLILYSVVIFSQVYRYQRVSTPVERQQTKWVVFGILVVVAGFVVLGALNGLFPTLNQPDTPYSLIPNIAYPLLLLTLPLSIGIAILRSRLYDIDVLINRTLVYGTLTVLLTLVYFGLVIGLESLVRLVTGQEAQSPVVIVASTLAIAALFRPLRRRLQRIIDRRFYRRTYDAARTLAAFNATLRNEVDLHQLREHLVAVVEETMQPTHVSLWLRKDEHRRGSVEKPPKRQ